MKSLLSIITNARFSLIVSLPKNDYNLAKAAWESGADAIKVHINVKHNASKQVFEDLTHYYYIHSYLVYFQILLNHLSQVKFVKVAKSNTFLCLIQCLHRQ